MLRLLSFSYAIRPTLLRRTMASVPAYVCFSAFFPLFYCLLTHRVHLSLEQGPLRPSHPV